jgi:membrane-bound lytic murein transglycosylase B
VAALPAPVAAPPPPPAVAVPATPTPDDQPHNPTSFSDWLSALRAEAQGRGFKPPTLAALDDLKPVQRIIDLDRKQPESVATLDTYLSGHVTEKRIARGREILARDRALLTEVAKRYGVQPRFILAILGLETDYGRSIGGFPVLQALATLAYDGRRASYFRGELIHALEIIDMGEVEAPAMRGSWAGAMGQVQFMPSSYLKYAVDFDGSGRRDIWTNSADVYASVANYLKEHGWRRDGGWGREVRLPKDYDQAKSGLDQKKPMSEWRKSGLTTIDGKPLPKSSIAFALILPPRSDGRAFLVQENYRAIRGYNPSHFYAIAIGQLADGIGK